MTANAEMLMFDWVGTLHPVFSYCRRLHVWSCAKRKIASERARVTGRRDQLHAPCAHQEEECSPDSRLGADSRSWKDDWSLSQSLKLFKEERIPSPMDIKFHVHALSLGLLAGCPQNQIPAFDMPTRSLEHEEALQGSSSVVLRPYSL